MSSIYNPEGKKSSIRISAYVLLGLIVITVGVLLFKEPSLEHITILGMLMAHHLTLLGINKHHESKNKK